MRNHNNKVVVWFPNDGLRTRNCQTTVYPEGYVRHTTVSKQHNVANFNNWSDYIRDAVNESAGSNFLVDEAKRLIRQPMMKSPKK